MNWLSSNPFGGRQANPRRAQRHKDVEFHVNDAQGNPRVFKTWNEAGGYAISLAAGGLDRVHIDVVVWSEAGARWWMGEEGVEQYREDPEASVFNRYLVKVDDQGRVA